MVKRLKEMLIEFLSITAGITICSTIFCTIFYNDVNFGTQFMWQIVALSFFCTLPGIIFISKKELTKKQMLARHIVHMCILLLLLLSLAYSWEWLDAGNIIQPIVYIIMFLFVYSMVSYITYIRDKKVAMKLNEKLAKYNQMNMD